MKNICTIENILTGTPSQKIQETKQIRKPFESVYKPKEEE